MAVTLLPRVGIALAMSASVGCGSMGAPNQASVGAVDGSTGADRDGAAKVGRDAARPLDAKGLAADGSSVSDGPRDAGPCATRVSYGTAWIRPSGHGASYDDVPGAVTWDGTCVNDGANSYALLSNGWKPYFQGNDACVMALDESVTCGNHAACTTRVAYGAGWLAPTNHPASYDDVVGRVFASGACVNDGADSYESLSNGWQPHWSGHDSCALSVEYTQCGGLYANPVIPTDCPDPGVLRTGGGYVLSCTSGDDPDAFPIYTSPDLVSWTSVGHIFPVGHWPSWAVSDFWAPEIHVVGGHFVAYFTARDSTGTLRIGAASASQPTGPFTDIGKPLIEDGTMGLIDPTEFAGPDGTPYAVWKEDGNAVGLPTPIKGHALASDGLSLAAGSATTLITNDQDWEGAVTEAPFMVQNAGLYYLFYSGNSYANTTYAVGVASAPSPLGPFTKASGPIVVTGGDWAGPGHCSVVDTPEGDTYMVYHAWPADCVDGDGCGRLVLTDAVMWGGGWPAVPFAPSSASRPVP